MSLRGKPQVARMNALRSWAATPDRTARTSRARAAADQRFYVQARELLGDGATVQQVEQSAQMLRRAWYVELAQRSATARRRMAA